jgi:hypothetical protein
VSENTRQRNEDFEIDEFRNSGFKPEEYKIMLVDGDDFAIIKFKIYLTWQPPKMISVFLPKL